jgi:hypothetical protein
VIDQHLTLIVVQLVVGICFSFVRFALNPGKSYSPIPGQKSYGLTAGSGPAGHVTA